MKKNLFLLSLMNLSFFSSLLSFSPSSSLFLLSPLPLFPSSSLLSLPGEKNQVQQLVGRHVVFVFPVLPFSLLSSFSSLPPFSLSLSHLAKTNS